MTPTPSQPTSLPPAVIAAVWAAVRAAKAAGLIGMTAPTPTAKSRDRLLTQTAAAGQVRASAR